MKAPHAVLIASLCLSGCGSNALSQQKAADLISTQQHLPETKTVVLGSYIKESGTDPSSSPAVCLVAGDQYSDAQARLAEWQSRGLISIGERREHSGGCTYTLATTALTDEGRKYLVKESAGTYEVRAFDLVFGEITRLEVHDQLKTAEADYTIRKANVTPFGHEVTTAPTHGRATFARSDDGWRTK